MTSVFAYPPPPHQAFSLWDAGGGPEGIVRVPVGDFSTARAPTDGGERRRRFSGDLLLGGGGVPPGLTAVPSRAARLLCVWLRFRWHDAERDPDGQTCNHRTTANGFPPTEVREPPRLQIVALSERHEFQWRNPCSIRMIEVRHRHTARSVETQLWGLVSKRTHGRMSLVIVKLLAFF